MRTPTATPRCTASTPASARLPRRGSTPADLARLQVNLLRSHAAGVDEPLPVRAVRAIDGAARQRAGEGLLGHSRRNARRADRAHSTARVHPRVPSRGSVGASGDLAPLAHIALVLIGEGEVWDGRERGAGAPTRSRRAGLAPVALGPKEGLALINGTQVSTAVAALALAGAERLARAADIAAALSIDALQGSIRPFDARIHAARPFAGTADRRRAISSRLVGGSPINASHANCGRVQDAYSMRCVPQVHGAAREALAWVRHIVADRDERRHRQPDGLRRHAATSSRAATFTARRSRSRPICWCWRSRSSPRSASGAPNGWSIRR